MSDDAEAWRAVPRWPGYEVSSAGRVRSVDRVLPGGQWCAGKVLRASRDRKGYWCVHLRDGQRHAVVRVHVLVAAAFHGERPAGMHILHAGDDKDRNEAERLRYGTARENEQEKRQNRNKTEREIGNRSPRAQPPESPGSLESQGNMNATHVLRGMQNRESADLHNAPARRQP